MGAGVGVCRGAKERDGERKRGDWGVEEGEYDRPGGGGERDGDIYEAKMRRGVRARERKPVRRDGGSRFPFIFPFCRSG